MVPKLAACKTNLILVISNTLYNVSMPLLSTNPLIKAAERLIEELGVQAESPEPIELQRLELCARVLCVQLKTIHELNCHNQRMAVIDIEQKYTRYEDLPPLTDEERDRLKQELVILLDPERVEATAKGSENLPRAPDRKH